jgi:hypothetical protein
MWFGVASYDADCCRLQKPVWRFHHIDDEQDQRASAATKQMTAVDRVHQPPEEDRRTVGFLAPALKLGKSPIIPSNF